MADALLLLFLFLFLFFLENQCLFKINMPQVSPLYICIYSSVIQSITTLAT